jgi:hypothetical protein
MILALLRLWKSLADDFSAVAPLEVARGWLVALLRCWKSLADGFSGRWALFLRYCAFGSRFRMALFTIATWKSFADDFCAVAQYCDFGSRLRMIFALLRLWKSLADDFFALVPLEVVCE